MINDRREEVAHYTSYRDSGGRVMWPHEIARERDREKIFQMHSDRVTVDDPLDDSLFALPGGINLGQRLRTTVAAPALDDEAHKGAFMTAVGVEIGSFERLAARNAVGGQGLEGQPHQQQQALQRDRFRVLSGTKASKFCACSRRRRRC